MDASIVVELLTGGGMAETLRRELALQDQAFLAPHLLDIEVMSAIRGLAASQRIDSHTIQQVLTKLGELPVMRCDHAPLLGRIWELRHNFTTYDAAYIALAEATDSVLYTCDVKLSKGHRARVALF
ncbi:MAG: type II toxin-antitoxin system VapC family toxin [Acidobacteriota bacterium]